MLKNPEFSERRDPVTSDIIRRFNRDTRWVALLVVGALVSVALGLAFLVQERYPGTSDPGEGARQADSDFLLSEESSVVKVTSSHATSVFSKVAEISNPENSLSQLEAVAGSAAVSTRPPEMNGQEVRSNENTWSQGNRPDAGRVMGAKTPYARPRFLRRPRIVDAKMRLLALWHRSLLRNEKSRSWTPFANSNKGQKQRVSYTVATNH
jgi:hypothetical protein